jgi:hypothetical protein
VPNGTIWTVDVDTAPHRAAIIAATDPTSPAGAVSCSDHVEADEPMRTGLSQNARTG